MREALACSCYVLLSLGAEPPFERERRLEQRPKYRRPSELLPRVSLIPSLLNTVKPCDRATGNGTIAFISHSSKDVS